MPAPIRPHRLEVSDRFPILGFTVNTDSQRRWFEVAVATEPRLFQSDAQTDRTHANFFSTRSSGPLLAERGESVFLLPDHVLKRFSSANRLYYGMATFSDSNRDDTRVVSLPHDQSPWINISSLSDRPSRRMTIMPTPRRRGNGSTNSSNGYGAPSQEELKWAGDTPRPGMQPAAAPPMNDQYAITEKDASAPPSAKNDTDGSKPPTATQSFDNFDFAYDDGFGAMPEPVPVQTSESLGLWEKFVAAARGWIEKVKEHERWRAGVSDTSFFPHSATCHLTMTFPDGDYSGTGFYIAPNRILTAAHNLKDVDTNADATSVVVTPGKNGTGTAPHGSFTVKPGAWEIHPQYTGPDAFDLAVIKTSTPPPNGEYFEILEELNFTPNAPIVVCGYGGETADADVQNIDGDTIRDLSSDGETFELHFRAEKGHSGSPIFYVTAYEDHDRKQSVPQIQVVGILASGPTTTRNFGCRLTEHKIKWINSVGNSTASQGLSAIPATVTAVRTMQDAGHDSDGIEEYENDDVLAQSLGNDCSNLANCESFCPVNQASTASSANFQLSEFHSKDGTDVPQSFRGNVQTVMNNLEVLRAELGDAPITIVSGYRSCRHNCKVGGATRSRHLCGQAADIRLANHTPAQVHATIEKLIAGGRMAQGGLGIYNTFVHYDIRGTRARWDRRTNTAQALSRCGADRFPSSAGYTLSEIPLDPGIGGRSIDVKALEVGDIILTTTGDRISVTIRNVTQSEVSHSMLYVGNGDVIEAVAEGVVRRDLQTALFSASMALSSSGSPNAILAVAFRHPDLATMDEGMAQKVRTLISDYANSVVGSKYDKVLIARHALFHLDRRVFCRNKKGDDYQRCVDRYRKLNLGTGENDRFICSELVVSAYAHAGLPLTDQPPHWSSPQDIVALNLEYVGHLVTPTTSQALDSPRWAGTLGLVTMGPDAVARMRTEFQSNAQSAQKRNCITIMNDGLRQLYGAALDGRKLQSTVQDTMAALQSYGLASSPTVFEFNDDRGRLTKGVTRPVALQHSVETWLLQQAAAESQSGWYVFGLSVMDGYHSVMIAMQYSGNQDTRIYWADQITTGWDDITSQLDQRLTQYTQKWWDPLPQNRSVAWSIVGHCRR